MRHADRPRSLCLLLLPLLLGLGSCYRRHRSAQHFVPVYVESEPNDDVLEADYFGVLLPGDRFFIDGNSSDLGLDPFDGFAFTAGRPIHVDFRLFHADPSTDFDVCLYDPQLDLTVACFATPDDPEAGGVDVTAGGLEFHLVVESFFGAGGYSLEIEVSPLYVAREAGTGEGPAIRASTTDSDPSRAPRALTEYGGTAAFAEPIRSTVLLSADESTGAWTETVLLEPLRRDEPRD